MVGFHCQQATEKYIKAYLVRHQVEFPKTHDIAKLLERVATIDASPASLMRSAEALTPVGVGRVSQRWPELLPGPRRKALIVARVVREIIRECLAAFLESPPA